MSRVYAVIYDLKTIFHDYSGLFNELKNSQAWSHYIQSGWLIKTEDTPEQIWNRIQPHIDKNDFVLIIEVRKNYQGWLPKEAWDWINEHVSY